jgi:hypothetical protein
MSKASKTVMRWAVVRKTWTVGDTAPVSLVLSEHRSYGAALAQSYVALQALRGTGYDSGQPGSMCGIDVVGFERSEVEL